MSKFDLEWYREYVRAQAEVILLKLHPIPIHCIERPQSGLEAYLDHMRKNYQHVNVTTEIVSNTIEGECEVINEPKQLEDK